MQINPSVKQSKIIRIWVRESVESVRSPVDFLQRCMKCRRGLALRILSVCLSVTRVIPDKMEERSVQIFIRPLPRKILSQSDRVRAKFEQ